MIFPEIIEARKNIFRQWSGINRRQLGGRGMPSQLSFLDWPPNGWANRAEILHSLWGVLLHNFWWISLPGQVRFKDLWHRWYSLRPIFQWKCVNDSFPLTRMGTLCMIKVRWPPLTSGIALWPFEGHPLTLTDSNSYSGSIWDFGGFLRSCVQIRGSFLTKACFSASFHYVTLIIVIDPVCPQTIFLMGSDVLHFRDALRHKYWIMIPKWCIILFNIELGTHW